MPIKLKVGSDFDEDDARKAAEEASAYYKKKAAQIKLKSEFDESAARATTEEVRDYFRRQSAKIKVNVDVDQDNLREGERGLAAILRAINEIGSATRFTARGLATIAAAPAGIALLDIAKGALTASQSIALLPAVAGAAAAAFGTLKMATLGFSDAIGDMGDVKKFATDLQSLAPEAQQAALSIQNLMPVFKDLQLTTQNSLFAGVGEEIHRLADEYLPEVKAMTTEIAGSFNQMLQGLGDQLMKPDTQAAMNNAMTNFAAAFKELVPVIPAVTQAFGDLMSVGSDFLPDLARSAADAARAFADFIREAKENGSLRQFIQDGIDAVGALASALFELGQTIYQVFGSDGKQNVEDFKDTLYGINEIVGMLGGNFTMMGDDIHEELAKMTGPAAAFRDMILDIPEALTIAGNKIIEFANFAIAQLNRVVDGINLINPFGDVSHIPNIPNLPASWGGDGGGFDSHLNPGGNYSGGGGGQFDVAPPGSHGTSGSHQREIKGLPPLPPNPRAGLGNYGGPFSVPAAPAGSGGGSGSSGGSGTQANKFTGPMGTEEQFNQIAQYAAQFGLVMTSGKRGYDPTHPSSFHTSGEAGDFGMPGGGVDTPQMLAFAEFMRQNFGNQLDEEIYSGPGFSGQMIGHGKTVPDSYYAGELAKHHNHVHIAAKDALENQGYGPNGPNDPTKVKVEEFGTSATQTLTGVFQPLAEDMGLSGGLPGVVKFLVTLMGNMALAGAIGGGAFGGPAATAAALGVGGQGQQQSAGVSQAAGPAPNWSADWLSTAQKESGGNWGIDTGNGYKGGLQFAPGSWAAAGGQQYAPAANLATPYEQALTAEELLKQQGRGAWPNTFTPGSSGPAPSGPGAGAGGNWGGIGLPNIPAGSGGGNSFMGMGAGAGGPGVGAGVGAAGPQMQGHAQGDGGWQPQGGGAAGLGGAPMEALDAAAGMVPGVGQAAQVGMKLANRAIGFAGQAAAIGVEGLFQTFLPGGGENGGDPLKSWPGKIIAGFAGARPAGENKAGKSAPPSKQVDPNTTQHGTGGGQPPGPLIGTMNVTSPSDSQQIASDVDRQNRAYGAGQGR